MTRRLYFSGMLLFLLAMLAGAAAAELKNPHLGVSAHSGGAMAGLFLVALGAVWPELRLGARAQAATFWTALLGFCLSSVGVFLAAALGTHRSTPIGGLASQAAPWKEAVVDVALYGGALGVLLCLALVLVGLAKRTA